MLGAVKKEINAPLTSSMGRLFDAVSALLNLRLEANYEGQPAIELEMVADESETDAYSFASSFEDGKIIINPEPVIAHIVEDLEHKEDISKISARFHNAVCQMVISTCDLIAQDSGITQVGLSGGVFQNFWLLSKIKSGLEKKGFKVYTHHQVPANDGGICLGQAIIGLRRMKDVLGSSDEG